MRYPHDAGLGDAYHLLGEVRPAWRHSRAVTRTTPMSDHRRMIWIAGVGRAARSLTDNLSAPR